MTPAEPVRFGFSQIDKLLEYLGDIPAHRVRFDPKPGEATEVDLIRKQAEEDTLFELVDGTLVEKAMGFTEGYIASWLGHQLQSYLDNNELGIVSGADSTIRLMKGLVRIPDLVFVSWGRLPDRKLPARPIPDLAPDLVVEVLSESNTRKEMERKLKEYFLSGVRLVWYVDPQKRTADVYTSPDEVRHLGDADTLSGGDVLPGFACSLSKLFMRLGPLPTKDATQPQ
jgi:Uma2 family endonuclease